VRDAINETLATLDPDGSPIHRVARGDARPQKVTGCLPTLTGDATRAQVFLEEARIRLGAGASRVASPADFRDVVAEFEAEIYQKPPQERGDPPAPNPYDLRSRRAGGRRPTGAPPDPV